MALSFANLCICSSFHWWFDALYKIVWHKDFLDVPKILETPYVKSLADAKKAFPPYKEEIDMLRSGAYDAARITKLAE